jgi:hypothetical protein
MKVLALDILNLDTSSLEQDPAVIYAVDASLRIVYCNAAWDRFALSNGGHKVVRALQVGRDLAESIPPSLQAFYWQAFEQVWNSGEPWTHEYECSSSEALRKFQMRVAPVYPGDKNAPLVIVNSLVAEAPHSRISYDALDSVYRDSEGILTMCCHCRRVRRVCATIWDWVPAFVRSMPEGVSHGLCDPCLELHYGSHIFQTA